MKRVFLLPVRVAKGILTKFKSFAKNRPNRAFVLLLVILLGVLIIGRTFSGAPETDEETAAQKQVDIYELSESPQVVVAGALENSQVKEVSALTSGFAYQIHVEEGDRVSAGQRLATLSSNLQGGNAAAVQAQIASAQYENQKNNFDANTNIINRQRELAEKTDANSDELRNITNKSLKETEDLIQLNEDILGSIADTPENKQSIAAVRASLAQLRATLRANEYQAGNDTPAADLGNIQRELALAQLDVQKDSLSLGLEIARLQSTAANIAASAFYPTAPFAGTVERVHISSKDEVSPGQILFTIRATNQSSKVVASVPQSVATLINKIADSTIEVDGEVIKAKPLHISGTPTSGFMYTVVYELDEEILLPEGSFIKVSIPLNVEGAESLYIPLDALHITQSENVVYIARDGKAEARSVEIGDIAGSFVQIIDGIENGEEVILSRNVIDNDEITY